ncbi:MAG: hypothetical protein JJ992_09755, partial [Planctomycetes bacterium]|nr:hypothetical protein [Planctomycetota bacterium]
MADGGQIPMRGLPARTPAFRLQSLEDDPSRSGAMNVWWVGVFTLSLLVSVAAAVDENHEEIPGSHKPFAMAVGFNAYTPATADNQIPDDAKPFPLWDATQPLPAAADIPALAGVTFHVIKKWDQKADGYTFLHGVGLGWYKGRLYASIGHNNGAENTVTEEAQYRVSDDGGRTWGPMEVIDAGEEKDLAVS